MKKENLNFQNKLKQENHELFSAICEENRFSMVMINYHGYLRFKDRNEYAGAITCLVITIRYLIYNIKDEDDNIKRICDELKEYINDNKDTEFSYGKNNIEILRRNIPEIMAHKDYRIIKEIIDEVFCEVLSKSAAESVSRKNYI